MATQLTSRLRRPLSVPLFTGVLTLALTAAVAAQGATLVKDIYPGTGTSNPRDLVDFYGKVLFAADTPNEGREPWITDGTPAGTMMLMDIKPGVDSSNPEEFFVMGGKAYFRAQSVNEGNELWVTDGTPAGTQLLKDINSGINGSGPAEFIARGTDRFWFVANDGVFGGELWTSDGTAAGTVMVHDLEPGPLGSYPTELTPGDDQGNTVFFAASTIADGYELWHSDGTTATLLALQPGAAGGFLQYLTYIGNGRVCFSGTDGTDGDEPYGSDGTVAGTGRIFDVNPGASGSGARDYIRYYGVVYFVADDGASGRELWYSDGNLASTATSLLFDTNPGSATGVANIFGEFNGALLLYGVDSSNPAGLYASYGLLAAPTFLGGGASPANPVSAGSRYVYFRSRDSFGNEVWRTDLTAGTAVRVTDVHPTSSGYRGFGLMSGGKYYFVGNDGGAYGIEVFVVDETLTNASSKLVGRASGAGTLELRSNDPVIGSNWDLSVDTDVPSTAGVVLMSTLTPPTSLFLPAVGLSATDLIYVDPLVFPSLPQLLVGTDALGDWSLSIPLPVNGPPSVPLAIQAVVLAGPGDLDLTNAVHIRFGH